MTTQTQPLSPADLAEHRLYICKALIAGQQCQIRSHFEEKWTDYNIHRCAGLLFSNSHLDYLRVRIKPEQRKVWVGWMLNGAILVDNENTKAKASLEHHILAWTEVLEPAE